MSGVRLAPTDLMSLGLMGLITRKVRAALSALGISIGIATLIIVVGIPASSHQALMDELSALGTDMLRAEPQPDQDPPIKLPGQSIEMVKRIGPVTGATAVANTHAVVRRSDRDDPNGSGLTALAAHPDLLGMVNGKVRAGRFLDAATQAFPAVVLGSVAAIRLGIDDLRPGEAPQILVGDQWFTVIGILDAMPLSPDLERSVLVGWPVAQARLGFDGSPTVVYLKARENAIDDVRAVLAATLYPRLPGMVQVSRPSDALAAKRATQNSFSALTLGLAGVALLVGGIGVANTMFISVLERRREIGLRRALGANRRQICGQFLTESALLSALGGLAGCVIGVLATVVYAISQDWPVVLQPAAVLGGLAGAVVVGVAAGVYPAIRASRLSPTEALATT
ncbi:ABC transporter permease [Amycolatopsis keratiniphila]|uniref:ABC transporter permease n=1 Tax=Amycolatopsis keratiniphila TaxID=129921 RepID=UPI00087A1A9F|nr:ABC transporter permease [Amycolatopsis keratiniphila]OLZ52697.1 ABC transporter permease [Amycolatopsis keratiniphila subsp. nogabecina]SDU09935.1 putative ABC transport system permease protein [Amycolatopsis keratiniphila]